jgi:NurA-like 5'-3' nuclease
MSEIDPVEFTGKLWAETEGAYQFFIRFKEGSRVVWLHKSDVIWDPVNGTMTMPRWLAVEKELI